MATEAANFPIGLSLDEARQRIVEIAASYTIPGESVGIADALGRLLTSDVSAPFDVPGFRNSAMDGYALRGTDLSLHGETTLRLAGVALAGGAAMPRIEAGTCVRITTGAVLPEGADTVVMTENIRVEGETIRIAMGTEIGANVRPAGEDYQRGDLALVHGCMLTPARLGALASFGQTHVEVIRRPRAVLLTTGDELTEPGSPLGFGGIYDSNRYCLGGLLEQHGTILLRHERLRDDPAVLRDALRRAGSDADIVISSGGVSAGEADYLPHLLGEVGEIHFWKVRIKPGMPFLCGRVGQALVFSLPGNPVSGIVTFLALVKPALDKMSGRSEVPPTLRAKLMQTIHKNHTRTELLRARVHCNDLGVLCAEPLQKQGSGMLRGVAEANALIVLPEAAQEYAVGFVVELLPLPGWV